MPGLHGVSRGWHGLLVCYLASLCVMAAGLRFAQAQSDLPCERVVAPVILDVPFISQMEVRTDCGSTSCKGWLNCGPASLAMVLKAYGCQPGGLSDSEFVSQVRLQMTGQQDGCRNGNTGFTEMEKAIKPYCSGLPAQKLGTAVEPILSKVRAGVPVIVAVNGPTLRPRLVTPTFFDSESRHIIVVTGVDDDKVYVNDPGYFKGTCSAIEGTWYYSSTSWVRAVELHGEGALAIGEGLSGRLEVVDSLALAKRVRPGHQVLARFTLRNAGSETIVLQRVGASARGPQGARGNEDSWPLWNAPNVDFPMVTDVHLAPNEVLEYQESRSFEGKGIYFAVLSYWDRQGTLHNLTGPLEFEVAENAPYDDGAKLIGRTPTPAAPAGARLTVSFQLQNIGCSDWVRGHGYVLRNVNNEPLGASAAVELDADVAHGEVHRWVLSLQAPGEEGTYTSEWQMAHGDQMFGPRVAIELRVRSSGGGLDEILEKMLGQLRDFFDKLRRQAEEGVAEALEQMRRSIEEALRTFFEDLQRQIEEAIQIELERELRSICGAGLIAPGGLLLLGLWLADRWQGDLQDRQRR